MNEQIPQNFQPLRYESSFEQVGEDEEKIIDEILKVMADIREKNYAASGHAMRSVHVKSHGLLQGELKVLGNLPDYLAQGLFSEEKIYPVVMRFSTAPGDVLPDSVSTPRGASFKVFDVLGERLPGSQEDTTQDFILVNGGTVFPNQLKDFLSGLKLFDATTNKLDGLKVAISKTLRGVGKLKEAITGSNTGVAADLGGEPETHILGNTFYSKAAFLYGDYMAKMSLVPSSPELKALTNTALDVDENPDALRNAIKDFFDKQGGEWEVRIQLSVDINKMPAEDASVTWDETESPYITVARITMPPQDAWSLERSKIVDDRMAFSPWHGLNAHRPLGSIMRSRKPAYRESAAFRAHFYGKEIEDKKEFENLPE